MAPRKGRRRVALPGPAYYDPALDENLAAGQRGLDRLIEDATTGDRRDASAWGYAQSEHGRQKRELGEDYATGTAATERGYGRSLEDLLTQRKQTDQDYGNNLADLQRNYERLGGQQRQGIAAAGLSSGGASAQAARKRAGNQALDKAPIDLAYQRAGEASKTSETRLGEDKTTDLANLRTQFDRGGGSIDRALGQSGLEYQYSTEDRSTGKTRAGEDQSYFELATGTQKLHQARQAGWAPPKTKPQKTAQQQYEEQQRRNRAAAKKAGQRAAGR